MGWSRRAWDESKHPRVPKGHADGGEFTVKGGKRVEPMRWYHGGPPLHGTVVQGKPMESWKTKKMVRGKTFATTSLKMAKGFAPRNAEARNQAPTVYRVALFGGRASGLATQRGLVAPRLNYQYHDSKVKGGLRRGPSIVNESRRSMRAMRLPSAHGRASRGRY